MYISNQHLTITSLPFIKHAVLVSMKMMQENPQMMKTAQKLMENMTPEQMLEQSKAAQEKMSR